jgi:hypothetical protein
MYPNWDFWNANIPSGNPDREAPKNLDRFDVWQADLKSSGGAGLLVSQKNSFARRDFRIRPFFLVPRAFWNPCSGF